MSVWLRTASESPTLTAPTSTSEVYTTTLLLIRNLILSRISYELWLLNTVVSCVLFTTQSEQSRDSYIKPVYDATNITI